MVRGLVLWSITLRCQLWIHDNDYQPIWRDPESCRGLHVCAKLGTVLLTLVGTALTLSWVVLPLLVLHE